MAEDRYGMRMAEIEYTYSMKSLRGTLSKTESPVSIDFTSHSKNHSRRLLNFALIITHKNYLGCKFIDDEHGILVHGRHQMTYTTYIGQIDPPVEKFQAFNMNGTIITYTYVRPIYRKHIKAMIKFIVYLHDNYISLAEFSMEENLLVVDGVLKFWRLTFIDATPESKKHDFQFLCKEIRATLFHGCNVIPPDINDLLQKMTTYTSSELLLVNHLSIMSPVKRITFFRGAEQKIEHKLLGNAGQQYAKYLKALTRMDYVLKNMGFSNWYARKFKKKDTDHFQPIVLSLNKGPKTFSPAAEGLLHCCRNLAAHVQEDLQQSGSDLVIDLMLSKVFIMELILFQTCLDDVGILHLFV